ncbi:CRISPR-associated endoribonuclease Cas6 [Ruminococcus sp.]|uniref:CRISPR-associated endoribonuclease Cas6 n=1 Tax=Ruminococcus sp. TaxID=41978 RepID=UPI002582C278|nr:CRISPR-associated endoribonuclease Cas6 [Ruminococcus sp.]MCR5021641.1 CRISPR-associated endoribonuclease Cas6 [Ruminococcus sp.]
MIKQLKIKFESDDSLKPNNSLASVFQGVLMEKIDTAYADELHISRAHQYSQYIAGEDGCVVWNINALDDQSADNIIKVLNSDTFDKAELKSKDITLNVVSKELDTLSYDDLLNEYYLDGKSARYITIRTITPTAFKSNGKYVIFPSSKLILNSIAKRYDAFSGSTSILDDQLSDYIEENTDIVEYDLRSVKFSLEGITIPSYIGTVKIKLSGNREFICLMNMLLRYGEYCGTGIKTSLGMGAYKIIHTGGMIK